MLSTIRKFGKIKNFLFEKNKASIILEADGNVSEENKSVVL